MTTSLPLPGFYGKVEIRHSSRGHWYAIRHCPDGGFDYLAQDIDLEEITARPKSGCLTPDCLLPVWHRNLCGMCLAKHAVAKARSIK